MPPVINKQRPSKKMAPKSSGNVMSRIKPVSGNFDRIKMLLYGRSGTGKTTLFSTFPKPMLIVGIEEGCNSVHNVKGLDFVLIRNTNEILELVANDLSRYKSFAVDTASSLQDLVLKEILGLDQLPTQRSWGMASQQQWGQCALKTKEYMRWILSLNGNVVIAAQERNFKSDESDNEMDIPSVGSALSPSVAGWLNPACDYIGQTLIKDEIKKVRVKVGLKIIEREQRTGKKEYCLRVGPSGLYTTKFRLPRTVSLPEFIVDPTYEKIVELIKG